MQKTFALAALLAVTMTAFTGCGGMSQEDLDAMLIRCSASTAWSARTAYWKSDRNPAAVRSPNTFSSILLGHSLSSGLRGDIRTMLNDSGTEQVFTKNGYSYTVTAEKQNDGTKTVTVTASIS